MLRRCWTRSMPTRSRRTYSLGDEAVISGPVARGEVGQVWKLTTDAGVFAIKEPFERPDLVEVEDDAAFQDLVAATGLSMPPVIRTVEGRVLADIGSACVRVYGWVDLLGPDRTLDPVAVGAAVASVHRVRYSGANGLHPWYTDPVGADRWDELIDALRAAGAPFAERLAEQRDELVALEQLIRVPSNVQAFHRDMFDDNVLPTSAGEVCIIDWENSGLADPGEEFALVLFEFAVGAPIGRARSTLPTASTVVSAWSTDSFVLDGDRPARAHRRAVVPALARPAAPG